MQAHKLHCKNLQVQAQLELRRGKEMCPRLLRAIIRAVIIVEGLTISPPNAQSKDSDVITVARVGHLQRVCRLTKKPFHKQPAAAGRPHTTKSVIETNQTSDSEEEDVYYINHVAAKPKPAIKVDLILEGKPVTMELDTGAPVSLSGPQPTIMQSTHADLPCMVRLSM